MSPETITLSHEVRTMKHTPGPWTVEDITTTTLKNVDAISAPPLPGRKCPIHVVSPGEINGRSLDEAIANARLIASAPDLLAALQYITQWNPTDWNAETARDIARAAIAKATGVQQ